MLKYIKKKLSKPQREIIVNVERLEIRAAVMEGGRLEEYVIEHPDRERIVGSIFKGRIQNLEHDLQAAFVDIGMKKNAFLHYWDMIPDDETRLEEESDGGGGRGRRGNQRRRRISNEEIAKRFPVNSEIVVQVSKDRIGTKGPRVTANLSLPGRSLVLMPGSRLRGVSKKIENVQDRQRLKKILVRLPVPTEMGLIVRTIGAGGRKTAFVRDLRSLITLWDEIQEKMRTIPAPVCLYDEPDLVERVVRDFLTESVDRIAVDSRDKYKTIKEVAGRMSRRVRSRIQLYEGELPIFEHFDVERQIEEASRRKVQLPSGGYIVFDETEALIAVDVNTGRYKGSGSQEEAILQVNTEAVDEVARQLRLRNVGGLVVIDLIDMKQRKHQNAVYRTMRKLLERDRARTNVVPISPLGLMEMTRQRVEESIQAAMFTDCPYCEGHGHVKSPLSISVDLQRRVSTLIRKSEGSGNHKHLQIVVHPRILERLRTEDEKALVDLEAEFDGRLGFKADSNRHLEDFEILDGTTGDRLYSTGDRS